MAPAKFTATPGLNQIVAAMCVDEVDAITRKVEATAKKLAPPTKRWISQGDHRVRTSHRMVEGDEIPDNLRFTLMAFEWDVTHPNRGGVTASLQRGTPGGDGWAGVPAKYAPGASSYLLEPRDRTGEHFVQIVNCRCAMAIDPQGVARMVSRVRARVVGSHVKAKVVAQGKHVIGAEDGEVYPMPSGPREERGTKFMRRTVLASAI